MFENPTQEFNHYNMILRKDMPKKGEKLTKIKAVIKKIKACKTLEDKVVILKEYLIFKENITTDKSQVEYDEILKDCNDMIKNIIDPKLQAKATKAVELLLDNVKDASLEVKFGIIKKFINQKLKQ